MDLGIAALTFAVVLPAELPDKSLLVSLVLGARYSALAVWAGVSAAFGLHVLLAVSIGGLLSRLPQQPVVAVTGLLFAVGAALLWRTANAPLDPQQLAASPTSSGRAAVVAFSFVLVGEFGDLTQIATTNLTAQHGDPLSVAVGALSALLLAAALAVTVGSRLLRVLPLSLLRRAAAVVFAAVALATFAQLIVQ